MSDIVERLKQHVTYGYMPMACRVVMDHAAAEITRLQAELAEARDKALDEAAVAVCGYIHPAYGELPGEPFASAAIRALKSPKPPIL